MSKRTIRILILVATASAALLVVAAPGIARRGHDDDRDRDRVRGTIASFTDGVLTIRQSNGDEVEGKVTRRTEIECTRDRSSTAVAAHDGGDDHGGRGRDHDEDDGDGDDHDRGRHRCSVRLLTAGRVVREADLLSTSSGPVFREVEIVR